MLGSSVGLFLTSDIPKDEKKFTFKNLSKVNYLQVAKPESQ